MLFSYTIGKRVKAVMVERISIEAKMIALYLLRKFLFEGKEARNSNLLVDNKDFVFWVWGLKFNPTPTSLHVECVFEITFITYTDRLEMMFNE